MENIEVPMPGARVTRVRTSGRTRSGVELDNNCFVVGDDRECLVIDASWDAAPIVEAVGNRTVTALVITHGHGDHCNVAADVVATTGAPVHVHPADAAAYASVAGVAPDATLAEGDELVAGPVRLRVLHTPGHTPGACCLDAEGLGILFTGDTLFPGGPGGTGNPRDFAQVMDSVTRLCELPEDRVVWPGHGDPTSIGAEKPHLGEWRERGW